MQRTRTYALRRDECSAIINSPIVWFPQLVFSANQSLDPTKIPNAAVLRGRGCRLGGLFCRG
jgi:hypothetical protein